MADEELCVMANTQHQMPHDGRCYRCLPEDDASPVHGGNEKILSN